MAERKLTVEWVLMSYRMPREPSTRRIAVWRKLDRLGVARLGDGLVALPADARTREALDWIAEEIGEGDGQAMVWLARPADKVQEQQVTRMLADARATEYLAVVHAASAARRADPAARAAAVRKLRDLMRRIARRDYFPPPERDAAEAALASLATPHEATAVEGKPRQRVQP
jgi:hypothetical protein